MRKVSEYEAHAEECRKLAGGMKNPTHKMQLEQMAHAWTMLAGERAKQILKKATNEGGRFEARETLAASRPEEAASS